MSPRQSAPIPKGYADWLVQLKQMAFFAQHCPDRQFGQQPAAQLSET